jgi:hypothetical protein
MTKRKSVRLRLRQLLEALLPYPWALRVRRRRLDRHFSPLVQNAKGDEREYLSQEWALESAEIEDELDSQMTSRLRRIARRYYVTFPPTPSRDDDDDEHWMRGRVVETWHLTHAGIALVQRYIEEAKARRRAKWESWAKILGGLITSLIALGSVIVSIIEPFVAPRDDLLSRSSLPLRPTRVFC